MIRQSLLKCQAVTFLSQLDEMLFFSWLERIGSISKVEGVHDSILLTVDTPLTDEDLREIIALFHRYGINKRQLQQFESDSNREWFARNVNAYWHMEVFTK